MACAAKGQKIVKNETDKFTQQKRVETNEVRLKFGLSTRLLFKLRSSGDACYAIFSGYGEGAAVIGNKDQLILLLDNDSTVILTSTGLQSYTVNQSTNSYTHQYSADKEDIVLLSEHKVKSIRKYTVKGYIETDIPNKNQDKIKETAKVFLDAL